MTAAQTAQEEAVLRTVSYFAVIGHAVTATDVWVWQVTLGVREDAPRVHGLCEMTRAMASLSQRGMLVERNGWYAMSDTAELLEAPAHRYLAAQRKWRTARRAVSWMRLIPGVRGIAVCNSLAYDMTTDTSDIDLFIITRPHAVWTVRLLCLAPLALLRRRPRQGHHDPLCVSFLVSDRALNLEPLCAQEDDIHFAHWLLSMVPMIDDGVFQTFWQENAWARRRFPNASAPRAAWDHRPRFARPWAWRPNAFVEQWLGTWQKSRLPEAIRASANRTTNVCMTDDVLKFHTNDRRAAYRAAWIERCQNLAAI